MRSEPQSANPSKRERGQTTVEFVLIVPFLLLFFFLIVDFGWLLKNWIVVTNAAREATRCTVAQSCNLNGVPTTTDELVNARINAGVTNNLGNTQVDIRYVNQDGNPAITDGDTIVVCVRTENHYIGPVLEMFSFVTGGALPSPLQLKAREEMRLELPPAGNPPATDDKCFT